MNLINIRAIGGAYAPEDALQEDDEPPAFPCERCGLLIEPDDKTPGCGAAFCHYKAHEDGDPEE